MSYFRRFEGYTLPPHETAEWTSWRIEEAQTPTDVDAATIEGPTAIIPADPPVYDFETNNAALATGWYRIVWIDEDTNEQATQWIPLRTLSPYAPTVGDIAAILRARTVEYGGLPVDTFTDQTNPTAQQVQQLIILYAPLVLARLGRLDDLHCGNANDLLAASTAVVAQRVALEVEASYWPEEVGDVAAVEARRLLLDADITGLVEGLAACRSSSDDGGDGGESGSRSDPAWRFPAARPLRF